MVSPIVERAKAIIISQEGDYGSVCINDNGALSIGCAQWHGGRAKTLLLSICNKNTTIAKSILGATLYNEITGFASWTNRILKTSEKTAISRLLITNIGKNTQDEFANNDILDYINHVKSLGFTDEETIIFLADIENQGGSGASSRIGKAALKTYGKNVTLEQVLLTACKDKVFKNYQSRRKAVYEMLETNISLEVDGIIGSLTIKALQKFLNVGTSGIMDKSTIIALQRFLNSQV
jgi:hypothetical protein